MQVHTLENVLYLSSSRKIFIFSTFDIVYTQYYLLTINAFAFGKIDPDFDYSFLLLLIITIIINFCDE